jgi:hypothetical protein
MTDGFYAFGPDGGQRGPFDTAEEALNAAIEAAAGVRTSPSREPE